MLGAWGWAAGWICFCARQHCRSSAWGELGLLELWVFQGVLSHKISHKPRHPVLRVILCLGFYDCSLWNVGIPHSLYKMCFQNAALLALETPPAWSKSQLPDLSLPGTVLYHRRVPGAPYSLCAVRTSWIVDQDGGRLLHLQGCRDALHADNE